MQPAGISRHFGFARPNASRMVCREFLRGEQHPHDLAAVLVMLENFLTDELTFAVAVGGEPNPFCGPMPREWL